jgi:5-methylcytosine-specific restriction protein A
MPIVELCTHPRCGRYRTERRHCAEHAAIWRLKDNARRSTHPRKQVYSHRLWPRVRGAVLARDDFTCQHCGHYDPTGRGLVCDHIHGVTTPGTDAFDPNQCQTLCWRCSGVKDGARSHTSRVPERHGS